MRGNSHVRFLEGSGAVMLPTYSTISRYKWRSFPELTSSGWELLAAYKRSSAKRRTAPRNARDRPPNGERFREMQETVRQMAKRSAKCKRGCALSGRGADYFVPFIASSSSIKSDVLLKGGTLCWPPSLPWLRSQSKKRPGRAEMISGGWREISL